MPTNRENDVTRIRIGDDSDGNSPPLRVAREIPLWGILSVLGMLGAQGVTMYYGQARLAEQMTDVRSSVRALTESSNSSREQQILMNARVAEVERRLTNLESRVFEMERKIK